MSAPETLHRTRHRPYAWLAVLAASQLLVALVWWALGWQVGVPLMLASHLPFVLAVLHPRAWLYTPVVARVPARGRSVWLTIDDGPSDDTLPVLDLLDRHGARATFFLVGERAQARPALVAEIVRRGHEVGNHSQTHPQAWFWALGPARMAREIGQAQHTLTALAGAPPRWFRSVVGMTNPWVAAPLRAHGLTRVAWSARGYDAVRAQPDEVLALIARDLAPGAIVLLHEGAPHGRSVAIIAAVLAHLDAQGYASVLPSETFAGAGTG